MESIIGFIERINEEIGITIPSSWKTLSDVDIARRFIQGVNEYFYQTHEGIGYANFRGEEIQYFSEFHQFWEENHEDIINARINDDQATVAAKCLSSARDEYGDGIFGLNVNTHGLSKEDIANVRYFTATQDFREPPENEYALFLEGPDAFEPSEIYKEPDSFLLTLEMVGLSQSDKRTDYPKNASSFLINNNITAYELAGFYDNDAERIRDGLVSTPNNGYWYKKANMFIRDMIELGVWPDLENIDKIDVASDINTMKIALRTGVLDTDIPLISSFLDIFCYQYEDIDTKSAGAWRRVWELWKDIKPENAPKAPCFIDFLIYRIGKEYCKKTLVKYRCTNGHEFFYLNARKSICDICREEGTDGRVEIIGKLLPCQIDKGNLPRKNGTLSISNTNLLHTFDGKCILEEACQPKRDDFVALDPPKSISVKGRTSWTSSYADKERGGGGMMG